MRGLLDYARLATRAEPTPMQRVEWLHRALKQALTIAGADLTIAGLVPTSGLIVCNHVSYIDIVALSAAVPCAFISKAEVKHFPIIGRFARFAGTVFVHRQKKADARSKNASVIAALQEGVPVVLFAEGGTTSGHRVARFHSTMLQPAIDVGCSVTPCAIAYSLIGNGSLEQEVHYWGDHVTLLPHLWNLLGKPGIRVRLFFGQPIAAEGDRKILGARLHDEVVKLYTQVRDPELARNTLDAGSLAVGHDVSTAENEACQPAQSSSLNESEQHGSPV